MRIETNVHDKAYHDLVLIAEQRGLSLAALIRTTMYQLILEEKWGVSKSRDGRSCDEPHIGGTD